MVEILCIIPARSGSKGIHDKNIMDFKGKPLLAWSIEQAQNCKYNMKIIVSTDSQEYANIAIKYGAEVPFLRPNNISDDLSTDFEFINHCVEWLKNNENYNSDIILQLRPTSPTRKIEDINKALEIFIKNRDKFDSLRSVILFEKSPFKIYSLNDDKLIPLFNVINNIQEPYNQPRQILPQCYLHNGYIDILNTSILNENTINGKNILPFIMDEKNNVDIDNVKDLIK
jgi:CMP-N-acetylneuraminic acid synthetase|tara:strand:- start:3349 stop:4032 length:684 start_codon:yes stop_codon:yes gene_type:complete